MGSYDILDGSRAAVELMLTLEDRLSARTAALEAFHGEFKGRIAAWLKVHRQAVESGLYENLALSGQHTPPVEAIDQAEARLSEAKAQLGLLTGSKAIRPGPMADLLRREVGEWEKK